MGTINENVGKFFKAMSIQDRLFLGIYLLIFIPIGFLLQYKMIASPDNVWMLVGSYLNGTHEFSIYTMAFVIVWLSNAMSLLAFFRFEDGAVKLMKYSKRYGDTSEWLKIVTNTATLIIIFCVNVFMFPSFLIMYVIIAVVVALMFSFN